MLLVLLAIPRENGELWWDDLLGFKQNGLPCAKGFKVVKKAIEALTSALISSSKPTWRVLNLGVVWASKGLLWNLNQAGNVVFSARDGFRAGWTVL